MVKTNRGTADTKAVVEVNLNGIPPGSITTTYYANGSVTETVLATSVAGSGLSGGGGSALSVNVDGTTIEIPVDTLQVADGGIGPAKLSSAFTTGTPVTNNSGLTAEATLDAYGADDESVAYTGIDNGEAGTVYAQLTDLNNLRDAYENLRAGYEDLLQAYLHLVGLLEGRDLIPS